MADKIPVKARYSGSDVISLGELEAGDTINASLLNGNLPALDGSQLTNLPAAGFTRGAVKTPTLNPIGWGFGNVGSSDPPLPSGLSLIYLSFFGVSVTQNTNIGVQIASAAGIKTSGYKMSSFRNNPTGANSTTSLFSFWSENTTCKWQGSILMHHLDGNYWEAFLHAINEDGDGSGLLQAIHGSGYVDLGAELNSLRFVADTGSYDGSTAQANIIYI